MLYLVEEAVKAKEVPHRNHAVTHQVTTSPGPEETVVEDCEVCVPKCLALRGKVLPEL